MICPSCNCDSSKVVGTKFRPTMNIRWRSHECLNPDCMEHFTTYEVVVSEKEKVKSKLAGPAICRGKDYGKWELKFIS